MAFGAGRHWIDDGAIVRRFGMMVTLNTVHPDRIRSVDREEFETIQRKTRSQTSVSSNLDNFGLDVQRDLVRSVTGQPENQAFGKHVTGADNLILSAPITFSQLADKCGEALDHYGRDAGEAPPVVSGIYQLLSGRSQPFSYAVRIGGVPHSAGVS